MRRTRQEELRRLEEQRLEPSQLESLAPAAGRAFERAEEEKMGEEALNSMNFWRFHVILLDFT